MADRWGLARPEPRRQQSPWGPEPVWAGGGRTWEPGSLGAQLLPATPEPPGRSLSSGQPSPVRSSLSPCPWPPGDFAYNMDQDNARVGDRFMRLIEPVAASLPYMTCPGNHEER